MYMTANKTEATTTAITWNRNKPSSKPAALDKIVAQSTKLPPARLAPLSRLAGRPIISLNQLTFVPLCVRLMAALQLSADAALPKTVDPRDEISKRRRFCQAQAQDPE